MFTKDLIFQAIQTTFPVKIHPEAGPKSVTVTVNNNKHNLFCIPVNASHDLSARLNRLHFFFFFRAHFLPLSFLAGTVKSYVKNKQIFPAKFVFTTGRGQHVDASFFPVSFTLFDVAFIS